MHKTMVHGQEPEAISPQRRRWLRYTLLVLIVEKIIQHVVVTLAFYYDVPNLRARVVINYELFMISGAIVALLFMLSFWGMLKQKQWTVPLIMALALFDIVGEFVAQGTLFIVITVSIVVATILLGTAWLYSRTPVRMSEGER